MSRQRHRRGAAPRHAGPAFDPVGAAAVGLPPGLRRIAAIDALRGIAVLLMIVYHFCFDLRLYRVKNWDFEHEPFWLAFRGLIVATFMLLVGISLVMADRAGQSRAKFWKRIALIAACAVAVSAASYVLFPRSFIYFGILHCIVAASVFASPLVRRPVLAATIGLAIVICGVTLSHPLFDYRALSWIGFTTVKPQTEDFVPLAPWAGLTCLGVALGYLLVTHGTALLSATRPPPRWLQWAGRHSLIIYMAHQPILLGVLAIALPWVLKN